MPQHGQHFNYFCSSFHKAFPITSGFRRQIIFSLFLSCSHSEPQKQLTCEWKVSFEQLPEDIHLATFSRSRIPLPNIWVMLMITEVLAQWKKKDRCHFWETIFFCFDFQHSHYFRFVLCIAKRDFLLYTSQLSYT